MERAEATFNRRDSILIYVGGAVTSAVTLALLYFLSKVDFNPLTIFFWFIVPAGAIGTGLIAGSGYSLVAWKTNVRVTTTSLIYIGCAGVLCFFLAHYMTYLGLLAAENIPSDKLSFLKYLQILCENTTYGDIGEEGTDIGKLGYVLHSLSGLGFAAGGIIPHLLLRAMPYCEKCQLYMKQVAKGMLSSKALRADLKKKKKPEKTEIVEAAVAEVLEPAKKMLEVVGQTGLAGNEKVMAALAPERVKDSIAGVTVTMKKCPNCENHLVKAALQNSTVDGQGKAVDVGTAKGLAEGERDLAAAAETASGA